MQVSPGEKDRLSVPHPRPLSGAQYLIIHSLTYCVFDTSYLHTAQTHPEGHGALTALDFKPGLSREFDGGLDGPQLLRNQASLSQRNTRETFQEATA